LPYGLREELFGPVVAAICLSPVVLACAGCLKGRKATVFPHPLAVVELKLRGARYIGGSVVVAGNVVTARDPRSVGTDRPDCFRLGFALHPVLRLPGAAHRLGLSRSVGGCCRFSPIAAPAGE
jgi:hypothetical protein